MVGYQSRPIPGTIPAKEMLNRLQQLCRILEIRHSRQGVTLVLRVQGAGFQQDGARNLFIQGLPQASLHLRPGHLETVQKLRHRWLSTPDAKKGFEILVNQMDGRLTELFPEEVQQIANSGVLRVGRKRFRFCESRRPTRKTKHQDKRLLFLRHLSGIAPETDVSLVRLKPMTVKSGNRNEMGHEKQ